MRKCKWSRMRGHDPTGAQVAIGLNCFYLIYREGDASCKLIGAKNAMPKMTLDT